MSLRGQRVVKGALVLLTEPFVGSVPKIVPFQFNPETLTRQITPMWSGSEATPVEANETSQPFDPEETLSFTLELDSLDDVDVSQGSSDRIVFGIADRLAALEMMMFPAGEIEDAVKSVAARLIPALASPAAQVPRAEVPIVLFCWGLGRVLPVRITSFSVTEQAFTPELSPMRAEVQVGLTVLRPEAFVTRDEKGNERPLSAPQRAAVTAYRMTRAKNEALALKASVADPTRLLPF